MLPDNQPNSQVTGNYKVDNINEIEINPTKRMFTYILTLNRKISHTKFYQISYKEQGNFNRL